MKSNPELNSSKSQAMASVRQKPDYETYTFIQLHQICLLHFLYASFCSIERNRNALFCLVLVTNGQGLIQLPEERYARVAALVNLG